jgi:hypothetical protein
MSESVSAAITIQSNTLRYAEIKRLDQGHRLLRMGEKEFPFDLARALLHEDGDTQQAGEVGTVLAEVFQDTEARELRVGVHPLNAYSFFTPISSDVPVRDRKRQLLQQAALVTGTRSVDELHMASQTVRTTQDSDGEPFMWVHVLAVPEVVDGRIEEIVGTLPVKRFDWVVSAEAASRVTSRVERTGGSAREALRPYTLAVGQYPTHTEYSLSRNREWYHAHYAEEAHSPDNRAYFAVGFLNRVGVPLDAVGRLFVYGLNVDVADYGPFVQIFDRAPEVLNPFQVVQSREDPSEIVGCAYAPCIGAGMDEYVG